MATTYKKISDITAASALDGTELLEAVQSSASVKATAAQVATYVHANPAGVTATSVITGEFQFTEDNELDYSGSFSDGGSGTITFSELPASTVSIYVNIQVSDTGTTPRLVMKRSSGGTHIFRIGADFADGGTNVVRGTYWLPTENNTIYYSTANMDVSLVFDILGYKTGA